MEDRHSQAMPDGATWKLAVRLSDEGQQLGCNSLWHLGVWIVPRSVNDQDVSMELRGEPTSFDCCIREVRIAGAHHDEGRHPARGHNGRGVGLGQADHRPKRSHAPWFVQVLC